MASKRSNPEAYNAYMKAYMQKRRAVLPPSERGRMKLALREILDRLEGNDKPLAVELRKLAERGLT